MCESFVLYFPRFDDAREIKSVWQRATLALYLLIANFSCNYHCTVRNGIPRKHSILGGLRHK